jgi:hypothetical protein
LLKEHVCRNPGKIINTQIKRVLHKYTPDLTTQLNNLADPRRGKQYQMGEICMAAISLFMLKQGSRNAFNLDRKDTVFRQNYEKVFDLRLPQLDTVEDVFRQCSDEGLEKIKAKIVSDLVRGKKIDRWKFNGHYIVAVDGTGVASYAEPHCESCLQKTSKKGVTTYFHNVLEAKLLTPSGLSISIATEWISNQGKGEFEKQDCERMAFIRLAQKVKKYYPRLPIAIVADGLYPWDGFFETCQRYTWKYIVVLKDGSLKSLQEEIQLEKRITPRQTAQVIRAEKDKATTLEYHWLRDLPYKKHMLNFVECSESVKTISTNQESGQRFVHLTNFEVNSRMCDSISFTGRLRQKIENEGFNTQKNQGYALQHKYSRASYPAMKMYYQCLQIAHIINQLIEASLEIRTLKNKILKCSIRYLWKRLLSYWLENEINQEELNQSVAKPFQIRLA